MSKVLIHYDTKGEPRGLWRQDSEGSLQSYYPKNNEKWATRAKSIINDREPNRNINDFFDHLTDHSSYFDHFGTIDSEDNEPFQSIWYRAKTSSYED